MTDTKPKIELVYFDGCPNAAEARSNLSRVLGSLALPSDWQEWIQDHEDTPPWARTLPSPTILVEGRSVVGPVGDVEGPACAPEGAPSVEAIRKALTVRGG